MNVISKLTTLLFCLFTGIAFASDLKIIANGEVASVLTVNGAKYELKGRSSISARATEEELKAGFVRINGFNVAFFDVPQNPLTYVSLKEPKTGVLGFSIKPGSRAQLLKYDPLKNVLYGKLQMYADAAVIRDIVEPVSDDYKDTYDYPRQDAVLSVNVALSQPLAFTKSDQPLSQSSKVRVAIEAYKDDKLALNGYQLAVSPVELQIEYIAFPWFEIAKKLCIQPVRIGVFKWPFSLIYTGSGLPFGLPGANTQWAKADVVFQVKDWITLWKSQYYVFDISESAALRNEVDDASCVEVFFPDRFSPVDMWGGGATYGSGTANAQIITSDGNADGGIDFTHLAHELGHAMDLPHPTGAPGVSTGTLMCPSGWMNDNPAVNSQENKDNISNPLFQFTWKWVTAGPDCNNSADCGPCP